MAVIASPLSNSLAGINQSTVSGSIFGGGNKVDAQTESAINANTSAVASLQKQVNELSQTNAQILSNLTQIGSFQAQVDSVRLQLNGISDTLQSVATITASESALEKQKDLYEQEKQKRLAEAGSRGGQENLLETKIQSALSEPVKRIGDKVSFGFNNLMSFVWTLLGGWLTTQGINVLKALQDGDKKKLNEIKDSVIKTLLVAGGVFTIINVGIVKVLGSIVGLTAKIGKFVIKNTIGKLFEGIAGLVKSATKTVTGGTKSATKGAAEGATKGAGEGLLSGISKSFRGIGKFAGPLVNLAFGGFDFMGRKKEGQTTTQAAAGATSSVLASEVGIKIGSKFPGWTKLLAMPLLGAGGYILGGKESDKLTGVDKPKEEDKKTAPIKSKIKPPVKSPQPETAKPAPTTSMTPPASNLQINPPETPKAPDATKVKQFEQAWQYKDNPFARGRIEGAWNKMSSEEKQQAKDWATSKGYDWKEMKLPDPTNQISPVPSKETPKSAETSSKPSTPTSVTTPAETSSKPSKPEITPAQTTKMQTVPVNIGPEPEPKPNIVYAPSGSSAPQQQQPLSTGPASDVPFISSSNTDNFYTLYSQINYNVVL
jgi:hypothetical protein